MPDIEFNVSRRGIKLEIADVRLIDRGFLGQTYSFSLFMDSEISENVTIKPGKVTFNGYGDIKAVYLAISLPELNLRKEVGSNDFLKIQEKLDTVLAAWKKRISTERKKAKREEQINFAQEKTKESETRRSEILKIFHNSVHKNKFPNLASLIPRFSIPHTMAGWKLHKPHAIREVIYTLLAALGEQNFFSREFQLHYKKEEKLLIIDYFLPSPSEIPDLKVCRYIASEDTFKETKVGKTIIAESYENLCYQLVLAVIYHTFTIDDSNHIESIAINGAMKAKDSAKGENEYPVILSAIFDKKSFTALDLDNIEPKMAFRKFDGVSAPSLASMTPVAPVVALNRDDLRFVKDKRNISTSAQGMNIAAMDWEDFEHLIREIFEKEFHGRNADVKVTRASSDGGVDAIVFDPDPILGGKIIIQAKRYTNTVGLSAVRDLYGTILNEGASKGILVTTSDFGPDAYKFSANKPITLLNGSNLLHMLEKNGVKATINIAEARKLLGLK